MHIHWKNFPVVEKEQNHNAKHGKLATISHEALCNSSLHCWHSFARRCGTNNDITVFRHSPLFMNIFNRKRKMELPDVYELNDVTRHWLLYVFSHGIYPPWCIFANPNNAPLTESESIYIKKRKGVRKDIERFFGVLKDGFRILRHELHEWRNELISFISQICIILHNMIVDMWERGELRSETNETRESFDTIGEFSEAIVEVSG